MKEKLFIKGGPKTRNKDFSYSAPIDREEIGAVTAVLKNKKLSGFYKDFLGGEYVQRFEKDFAGYIGVKNAISVNSGTSALHVALAAAGIGPGDEVIVPPYTFTATASAVLMNNAVPIFADIEYDTLCIDADKIKRAITKRTKAVIPVHLYGKVAPMDRIRDIVSGKDIMIIEDACQAPGSKYKGKKAGAIGDMGVFSFVETKNIVIGEGGMITTDDDKIAERCRLIRNHGEVWMKGGPRRYLSNMLGYNFRLTEMGAALGVEQLKKLDYLNGIRQKNASFLQRELGGFKGIGVIRFDKDEVCHIFPILFDEKEAGISRDKFVEVINSEGIPLSRGYPRPLYDNPIFREKIAYGDKGCPYSCPFYGKTVDYKKVDCKIAEDVCDKLLCVKQVYYPYGINDMKDIVRAFKKVFDNLESLR